MEYKYLNARASCKQDCIKRVKGTHACVQRCSSVITQIIPPNIFKQMFRFPQTFLNASCYFVLCFLLLICSTYEITSVIFKTSELLQHLAGYSDVIYHNIEPINSVKLQ